MIKIHHLNFSRSTRIIWLMEELGLPYEIASHSRNPQTLRSPPSLEAIHPLSKAPVIEDGTLLLAESGAIIEYILTRYGRGQLAPASIDPNWPRYIEMLHYAEGSAMMPILISFIGALRGDMGAGLKAFIDPEVAKQLSFMAHAVGAGYLVGDTFTAADIQMSYVVEIARMGKLLDDQPTLQRYMDKLEERPAYKRAIERGGPVPLPLGG